MRIVDVLIGGAALAVLSVSSPATSAELLFDNLSAASGGTESAQVFESGPLYDSFSTGSSAFFLSSISLLLNATDPSDGGEYQLAILADNSGSPGEPISEAAVSDFKPDSDLSTSLEVHTFFPHILLDPNTRTG
jgi:hypothetical protein